MAELVGGALLSAFFQTLFQRIDSDEIDDFFRGRKQVRLLEKLKKTLLSVQLVLDDAETKQLRNPKVRCWVEGLRDATEDAENLLEEISTDALEAKILSAESGNTSGSSGVKGFFSVVLDSCGLDSCGRARKAKMEEILERFEYFQSQKEILGLTTVVEGRVWHPRLPSTSLVEDSEVYGRKQDKDDLKKLLLSDNAHGVSVIPIVGMGGVGKTTLAQAIFNDDEIKTGFEVKAWICVSEEFDVCRLTKTVLEAVTNHAFDTMDLNKLQVKLKEMLEKKKFLVVLDDVWSESYNDWDLLRRPFQDGAKGSKMIVTTRSERVASVMGSSPTHNLVELSDEDCWELFAKHASGNGDFMKYAKLEAIGREIVKKCKGLPLAAKTLGGLLRSTIDVEAWERVLESDIWDFTDDESNILPALRVSYHYLPSHLKRCFAHCSMFPKDYEFQKEELVSLWMAENLVGHSKRNKRMEDVGDEYFSDLVSRSFFKRMSEGQRSWFVMHDLMVDLAKFVSGNSFQFGGLESSSESVMKMRHLAYFPTRNDSYKRFNRVLDATHLRTFLPLKNNYYGRNISDEFVHDLLLKFKCLRYLSLHGYRNITKLPNTIGELKHLCYLDLSRTAISELPESVCGLYNLQTLDLSMCDNLKSLPRYMHRLINLRRLHISYECIEMPAQMSKLKNLQTLNKFIVGKDGETRLPELRELSNLRGSLCIEKLSNVVDAKDASEATLIEKKHLSNLLLNWGGGDTNDTTHEKLVLKNLAPSTSLHRLRIYHYGGTSFPKWVGDHTYCNIVEMELSGCKYCTSLPPLGQLASLKTLEINDFPTVEVVDHNFYGSSTNSSSKAFPSLEELVFSKMSNWKEWKLEDVVAFLKLEKLRIDCCPEFTGNLPQILPSLTDLSIQDCRWIDCSLPTMPAVKYLKLVDCGNLLSRELPPTIQSLHIERCGNKLVSLSETLMKMGTCLQYLEIRDCPSLSTLGNLSASLNSLVIFDCAKLEFPFASPHESLKYLTIKNSCDSIHCFPLGYFTNLTRLDIIELKTLESLSMFDGVMPSLSQLMIYTCPNLVSFPAGGFSAPKLTSLRITDCEKLKWLPEQMHTLFPSLEHLQIGGCPEVESFPEAGLQSNLRNIDIGYCDKLVASRTSWNLTRLTKLVVFGIGGCSEIRCFPEEGLLPTSITNLTITDLSSLETLDKNGLRQLTSLKYLYICGCPKLRSIPVQELPNSLEELNIWGCPLLRSIPIQELPSSLEELNIMECPLLEEQSDEIKKQIRDCHKDILLQISSRW